MFFLADKAYRERGVPPVTRTVRSAWTPLLIAGASAIAAVAMTWVSLWG